MNLPATTGAKLTPRAAAAAYGRVEQSDAGAEAGGFGQILQQAMSGALEAGHAADAQATEAIMNGGNLTEVVSAIARAELALQTTVAVRDRVVQAYQDIMRMPI